MSLSDEWINGTTRRDGLRIAATVDGNWIVLSDHRPPITACPCCTKPFSMAECAREVADTLRPMQSSIQG